MSKRDEKPDFSRVHAMKVHDEEGPLVRLASFLALYALFAGIFAGIGAALPTLWALLMAMGEAGPRATSWAENDTSEAMRRRALIGGLIGVITCATIIFLAVRGKTFGVDSPISRTEETRPGMSRGSLGRAMRFRFWWGGWGRWR